MEQIQKRFRARRCVNSTRPEKQITLDEGSTDDPQSVLMSYFSPNTTKTRSKTRGKAEVIPIDMKDLSERINAAKSAVLFLAFIPGTPSITEFAAAAQKANKDLFVRGCVTSPDAAGNYYYDLQGTSPPKTVRPPGSRRNRSGQKLNSARVETRASQSRLRHYPR
jgi:hypothetical protein